MTAAVLYVDDEANVRQAIGTMLERLDCDVKAVEHGFIAVDEVKKNKYDIIFLDMKMPELDGIETCRFIRKIDGYEKTPIIGMSGISSKSEIEEFSKAGINEFVAKPIAMYKFQEILEKWV